jgi:hypothetical protein
MPQTKQASVHQLTFGTVIPDMCHQLYLTQQPYGFGEISIMRKVICFVLFAACFFFVGSVRATVYYVDYASGADSNNGTSKSTPWKHAPGMLGLTPANGSSGDGCTAVCGSTTIRPGDSIILKGGTVWPYSVLPWEPNFSGSSTTGGTYGCVGNGCIYIGNDPTWNAGVVNSVTLTRDLGGCNPASPPTVTFSGGGGSGAAATATVIPAAAGSAEPNVAGFVLHVTVTSRGSGYTSAPNVTISGGGCTLVTAVADIQRPIIDAGKASGIDWPVGFGPGNLIYGPGLTPFGSFLIIDHLEIRNILQIARAVNGVSSGIVTAFLGNEQASQGNITYSNNYIHGRFTDCTLISCIGGFPNNDQEQADRAIILNNATDEASFNFIENGDGYFTGTSLTTCGNNNPCAFSEHSINTGNNAGASIHHNHIWANRWMIHMGGSGNIPALMYNNEAWLTIYDSGSAHVNEFYALFTTATFYEYNNIFHNTVSGSSNQQQMGNGTTEYFFNNVSWTLGGGTANYGIDTQNGAGPGGGKFYFFNNTFLGENPGATRVCVENGSGGTPGILTVVYQNNHCITAASPSWLNIGANWITNNGSTNIAAANVATGPTSASSEGYRQSNLFAPTQSSNDTVVFQTNGSSANLSGLCSGNLAALCRDINGNQRPAGGGWQAGAYMFGGTGATAPPVVVGVTAIAH